jgi:hypothetical protein
VVGAWAAVAVDAVVEAGDRAGGEPGVQGDAGIGPGPDLVDQRFDPHPGAAVKRAAERPESGEDNPVGTGPGRCRDPRREGRRREFVIGEQDQRRVERRDLLRPRLGVGLGERRPEPPLRSPCVGPVPGTTLRGRPLVRPLLRGRLKVR